MKLTGKLLILLISATAIFASCAKDDTIRYNNLTMGNIENGIFTSDQGNIFTVVENNSKGKLEDMKRAIVLCDVLKQVDGKPNEYEIRLNDIAEVFVKAPITAAEAATDPDKTVEDPICIDQCWISGGYLNLYIMYNLKSGSTQKHMINLVLDESASSTGKYELSLRHNSFGDNLESGAANMLIGGGYVSFPINGLVKEDSAELTLNWKWYKNAEYGWSSETQMNSYKLTYIKGGYEQAPASLTSKANTNIN